jgi:ATP-dependent DNA helicase DinG
VGRLEIEEIFSLELKNKIRNDIIKAEGQEIYLAGKVNESSNIFNYKIIDNGNKSSASSIINNLNAGDVLIHNHPSGDLNPSASDIHLASRLADNGIGFIIINNEASRLYILIEARTLTKEKTLDKDEILSFFKENGKLSTYLADYEIRNEQIEVVEEIIRSFNNQHHSIIEAGTGTGKSFAYLIPAIFWSKLNKKLIVVSTNTINLQEQLIEKDLILLKKVLPFSFKVVLVKGRGNYVCLRRLRYMEKRFRQVFQDDSKKIIKFLKILDWIDTSESGSKSELKFSMDNEIWNEIASDSELCLKTKCPFFDSCFFMKARKEIYTADLLIVNHHLLLADAYLKYEMSEDNGILPKYKHLIIDEAHNLDDIVTRHLGRPFYYIAVKNFLEHLYSNSFSLLPTIRNTISVRGLNNKKEILEIIDVKIIPLLKKISDINSGYINSLNKLSDNTEDKILRITNDIIANELWHQVLNFGDEFIALLKQLGFFLSRLHEELIVININLELDDELIELELANKRCQKYISGLEFNLNLDDENYVYWLEEEYHGDKKQISQRNAPLVISSLLSELLWKDLNNIILTSATLTVNNSFEYFKDLLGIEEWNELKVESPFNYEEQAKLIIPINIPYVNSKEFLNFMEDNLKDILIYFGGSSLVLFTSYSMLNFFVRNLEGELNKAGLNILPQGRFSRTYILNTFKKESKQIIFGTNSFWEGIDIKGDKLKYLIIMKLPFPVPSEPIAAARMEQLVESGENPFYNYSLPRAVIRFRQGFGRLIRSKKDNGIIISLDKRLYTKSYGKVFLNSLPSGCPVEKVYFNSLIKSEYEGDL